MCINTDTSLLLIDILKKIEVMQDGLCLDLACTSFIYTNTV